MDNEIPGNEVADGGGDPTPVVASVVLPSPQDIEEARTTAGGWTKEVLAKWGVPWPPPKGWREALQDQWYAQHLEKALPEAPPAAPDEYAIVEIMGRRTIIGRVSEVTRFGGTLMSIEPIYRGELLPAVLINSVSIYQYTPCSEAVAKAQAPKDTWQLPASVRFSVPVHLLEAADAVLPFLHDDDDDREEEPF